MNKMTWVNLVYLYRENYLTFTMSNKLFQGLNSDSSEKKRENDIFRQSKTTIVLA